MKLAEFLEKHIHNEGVLIDGVTIESGEIELIIQQGIEAFESTEQVQVTIVDAADGKMPWREGTNIE